MDFDQEVLDIHSKLKGKVEITAKKKIASMADLSLVYTPGVAVACKAIVAEPKKVWDYTGKGNRVAIVTDGTAILGLGDIGPEAGLPVMEGKAMIFKEFANIDAFPLCLKTKDTEEIINIIKALEPSFAGINLEDISAPRCFEIESRLRAEMNIPVFHDDQHGTAIVVLAGLINATKVAGKKLEDLKIVVSGAGAAGTAIVKLLLESGVLDIVVVDSKGLLSKDRFDLNEVKTELASLTNHQNITGGLDEAVEGRDVFIGVSSGDLLTAKHIQSMATDSIVFALANPNPEIDPSLASSAGALVVATGRSDYPNQINNALVFPGVFRGLLDGKIKNIDIAMEVKVAKALASCVSDPNPHKIIPEIFDEQVVPVVAKAVNN